MAIDFTLSPAQRALQLQSRKFAAEVLAGAGKAELLADAGRALPRDEADL
ncbi:hypothetical protein ACVWZR_002980 [Bradyrhizobium sp. i1.3.1]